MQYGDYDPNFHKPGFLAQDELLPKRVSIDPWAFRTELHKKLMSKCIFALFYVLFS